MKNTLISGLTIFLALYFGGCNQTSGPCDWTEYQTTGKVVSIDSTIVNGEKLFSVELKFIASSLKNQKQYLEKLQEVKLTKEVMQKNQITHGVQYKFIINDLVSGNCQSPVISFQHQLRQ